MRPFEPMSWDELSDFVKEALPKSAPTSAKLQAARALLPMGTTDLASLLFYLASDEDVRIRTAARRSLTTLPRNLLAPLLSEPISPKILHWFAHRSLPEARLYEVIALNRAVHDETILHLAGTRTEELLLNIIADNQERLLRSEDIVRALLKNEAIPLATSERVRAFVEMTLNRPIEEVLRAKDDLPPEPLEEDLLDTPTTDAVPEAVEPPPETVVPAEAMIEAFDKAEFEDEDIEMEPDPELFAELERTINLNELAREVFAADDQFANEFLIDPEQDFNEKERRSFAYRVRRLNEVDKMRLGMKGNMEARQILMKSPNKMVQEAVLKNPRITIEEVLKLSKDKTAREEIIRVVTSNRDWTKNYQVVHTLCWNPKTPMTIALKFLTRLNARDLQQIAKSKQVPGMVSVQAKKMAIEKLRHR